MKINQASLQIYALLMPSIQANSNDKKIRILEATIDLLASEGIEKITFEALGNKLKTTKANIRYHFQNKDELIFMAIQFMVLTAQQITSELVEASKTPAGKLNGVILGAYRHLKTNPNHVRTFMMYFYYASLFENYNDYYKTARMKGQQRISNILQDLPRVKGAKSSQSLFNLAEQVQNLITGQIFGMVLLHGSYADSLLQTQSMVQSILKSEGFKWDHS